MKRCLDLINTGDVTGKDLYKEESTEEHQRKKSACIKEKKVRNNHGETAFIKI